MLPFDNAKKGFPQSNQTLDSKCQISPPSNPHGRLVSIFCHGTVSGLCNRKKAPHSRSAIRPNVFGLVNFTHLHGLPADTREGKAYPVIGSNDGKLSAKRDQFRQTPSFLPPADPANHQKCCLHAPKMICAANAGKNTSCMAGTILCTSLHAKGNSPSLRPTPPQKPFSSQNAVILRCTERDNDPVPVIRLIQHMESFFVKTAHDAKKPPYSPTKRHKSTFSISNIKQRTLLMNSE